MKKLTVGLALSACILVVAAPAANATLLHLWDFEAGDELADSVDSLNLNTAPGEGNVGGVMGTAADISYEPGYGGVGQAYRPYYVDVSQSSTAGAGLTGSGFTSPNQFTIEAIVKADAKTSGSAINYIFQTRPGSDRGYYLVQDEDGIGGSSVGGLGTIVGNNFGDVGLGPEYASDGTWIYIAAVIDLISAPGQAALDVYAANLSAGETVPLLVLNDKLFNTADPSVLAGVTGIFGIGNFAIDRNGDSIAEASQEWFQGAIDYVAIYDGLLDAGDLSRNLAGRISNVPEPSSLALVLLAGLLLLRRRHAA